MANNFAQREYIRPASPCQALPARLSGVNHLRRSAFSVLPFSVHCTFAVTDAFAFNVNVHVLALLPPLEQAPDQIASRPLVTLSVIDVPVLNDADPVAPTLTLIPAGLEVMRSPLRPVAVTVKVAVDGAVLLTVTLTAPDVV